MLTDDAFGDECDRQGIDIVLRVVPRAWDRPDVDGADDRVSLQQVNEVGEGRVEWPTVSTIESGSCVAIVSLTPSGERLRAWGSTGIFLTNRVSRTFPWDSAIPDVGMAGDSPPRRECAMDRANTAHRAVCPAAPLPGRPSQGCWQRRSGRGTSTLRSASRCRIHHPGIGRGSNGIPGLSGNQHRSCARE
jgi:hypothetical protein